VRRSTQVALKPEAAQPLYLQVKQLILDGIRAGEWDDKRLPSEQYLVDRLNVSRMTVHRALRELKSEGILVRVPGRGTFVSSEKPRSTLLETQDIAEEIRSRGSDYRCGVEILEPVKADRETAAALELKPGDMVYHSLIVHEENGAPLQLEERWINPRVAPGYIDQDFTRFTPHAFLTRTASISEVEHVLHAIRPDERVQRYLQISKDDPCLLLVRRTWAGAVVATRSFFIYPGDRYSLGGRYQVFGEAERPLMGSMHTGQMYGPSGSRPRKKQPKR
jgi:GntR family histidine utilization transcriptional repressor